ncbi:exonuclease 1 isoform X2 [Vigna unguiculata]|uniref:exonuclease 1 isoform X2 n=1 Tax=Vigna unguiculata TaxID=3917 RepID=UPI001016B01C|nr:exonuclease 1 isoform X2 [Vigna unguiculata]
MGIQGFLPLLKSIMVPINIKDLKGCSVAVDTYSWLHKGALSCSTELCKGIPTTRHIEYCMHRVNLLRHYGVKPILVFDGGLLPMKNEQEIKRARARKDNFARAVEHESDGNSAAAYECYQKAVDISPQVARELIQVLKQENVQYIVAPYEADAQMTFLAISGQVDVVITEDSDLIPFGCPRILFKMDKFGQGVQFQYSMLQKNKELNFEGFNRQMVLEMCILSGCDYLQSLPGMGLKRAHASIKKFGSYDKVLKHLRYSGVSVPPLYEESFKKAIRTFQYQRVYDPINENIVHLSNIPDDIGDELDFLGPPIPKDIAQRIAKGDLDPITKMPFEGENLTARLTIAGTSQFETLRSESTKKKIDLPVQKNLLTKYFSKRKFRAPRVSPTAANETKNCTASKIDYEISGSARHPNCHTEYDSATKLSEFTESPYHVSMIHEEKKNPEHALLQQPRQPIHKPCLGLHKEHGHTNAQDTVEEKTREVSGKVIVRSAYFQHKQVEKNACDEKHEYQSSGIVIDERKKAISDSDLCNDHLKNKDQGFHEKVEGKTRETGKAIVRSAYFQHKQVEKNVRDEKQECQSSGIVIDERKNGIFDSYLYNNHLKNKDQGFHDIVEGKTRETTRKVIVRSAYFQHKQVQKNVCDEKQDYLSSGIVTDNRSAISDSDLCNNQLKNKDLKRKLSPNDNIQDENLHPRQVQRASPPQSNGCCDHNVEGPVTENNGEEEKFGTNISHLGQYSEIAEKSMERFVSVISSFRCTSGTRVSGLRAPLKDVRNTSNNRPKTVDFGQYAYVPKNTKIRRIAPEN